MRTFKIFEDTHYNYFSLLRIGYLFRYSNKISLKQNNRHRFKVKRGTISLIFKKDHFWKNHRFYLEAIIKTKKIDEF